MLLLGLAIMIAPISYPWYFLWVVPGLIVLSRVELSPMPNAKCQMPDAECQVSNAETEASSIRNPAAQSEIRNPVAGPAVWVVFLYRAGPGPA